MTTQNTDTIPDLRPDPEIVDPTQGPRVIRTETRDEIVFSVDPDSDVEQLQPAEQGRRLGRDPIVYKPKYVGDIVKRLRRSMRLTQPELSYLAGWNRSASYCSEVENNKVSPSWEEICRLAQLAGVTIAEFLEEMLDITDIDLSKLSPEGPHAISLEKLRPQDRAIIRTLVDRLSPQDDISAKVGELEALLSSFRTL